jgi:hypothetical protein
MRNHDDRLEECVEIYLDPGGDGRQYIEMQVNSLGTVRDLLIDGDIDNPTYPQYDKMALWHFVNLQKAGVSPETATRCSRASGPGAAPPTMSRSVLHTNASAGMKTVPGIDIHRIAVAGNSFGGQLTLLAAELDSTIRAVVTFAGAAGSWERSAEVRDRLLTAVRKTNAAIMLIHAENDYSTAAGRALAEELERLHKPHSLKIYPKVGLTSDDGHNMLYENIPAWEDDVFKFLDQHVKG